SCQLPVKILYGARESAKDESEVKASMRERIVGAHRRCAKKRLQTAQRPHYRSRHELVSKAGYCEDKSRFLGVIAQFLAKAGDVDIYRTSKSFDVVTPHLLQYFVT